MGPKIGFIFAICLYYICFALCHYFLWIYFFDYVQCWCSSVLHTHCLSISLKWAGVVILDEAHPRVNLEHGEISNLWNTRNTTGSRKHPQSNFPRFMCVWRVWFALLLLFPSVSPARLTMRRKWLWPPAGIHQTRPLCLLLPKMSKRTVLSAFLRLTRSSAWAKVSDSSADCFSEFHWRPKPECDAICSCGSSVAYKTLSNSIILL